MKRFSFTMAVLVALAAFFPLNFASATAVVDDLVMCPDSSTVYYIGEDGNRHAFFNEHVFYSWYPDFEDVKVISCTNLATLPLGNNLPYQAGTRLIKIVSNPTVYVVEPDGLLRPLTDEAQAEALFGDDWADRVDDIDDGFFPSFDLGPELEDNELPEGLILEEDDGDLHRINENGDAIEVDELLEDADEEELFRSFALDLEETEIKIKIEIHTIEFDELLLQGLIDSVLESLQAINVADEVEIEIEVEVEGEGEVEGEDVVSAEDAEDAIQDAAEEYERSVLKVDEREAAGEDVTSARALLVDAENLLDAAVTAQEIGNYASAELLAEEARDLANDARMGREAQSVDEADEPDVDEPDVDEPDVDEPDVDEPDVDEPDVDEPDDSTDDTV